MSRYVFEGPQNDIFVVGWDNPMQTFFAEYFKDISDEDPSWATPMKFGFIKTLENFAGNFYLNTGARFPTEVMEELQRDFANRTAPSPLQDMVNKMFS